MKRTVLLVSSAILASVGISLEQNLWTAFWEAQADHHMIGDQFSAHDPAGASDEGDEPKPLPLQASATFEGGLRGELNAVASLGPTPPDRLAG